MTDMDDFDRLVAKEVLHASAPPRPVDDAAIFTAIATQSPKWRFQTMFSAIKFVAAGVIVALFGGFVLSGVLTEPATGPAAPGDSTLVVAQDGSGDFREISAAIAAAEDGMTVLVKPGTYAEAIVIDKDITLTGDGDREAVIIAFSDGKTPVVTIADSDAVLSNLTLTGEKSQVLVSGGAPTLEGLLFDEVGIPYAAGYGQSFALSLKLTDGTRARVTGNTFVDGGEVSVWRGSAPLLDDNELSGGPHIYLPGFGDGTVIRGNTVGGALVYGIFVGMEGSPLIEDNTIIDAGSLGIRAVGTGVIRDNTISGSSMGIMVLSGAQPTIVGNEVTDNGIGISLTRSDALVVGNTITGGDAGLVLLGGSPTLDGNTVRGASNRGIVIGNGTSPTLTGNTICDNATNLFVEPNATPVFEDNEICEDALAEPNE